MRIDQAALPLPDNFRTLRDKVERRDGQHKAQTRERLGRTDQGGFQLKSIGFIVQKVLFDIEP